MLDNGSVALDGTPHDVFGHSDELRAIGVDSPRTARISNSLASLGLVEVERPALTVDEAQALVMQALDGRTAPTSDMRTRSYALATLGRRVRPHHAERPPSSSSRASAFSYGAGCASVDDIDLTVRPGEILGVVGQNGAGKTTLTKLLNGLLKPVSGSVRIAGLDTRSTPVSTLATHVATLFQNPDRQLCRNTVLEEVSFGLELHGVDTTTARERADAVIERFGLPAQSAPFSLSRGQRQMVALAGVVVLDPELIILDEPTSGLDYRECMTVMETVRKRAHMGAAVIMICHDMEVVSDFATRIAIMARGRILDCGPTHRLFTQSDLLEQASITPPQVIDLSERLADIVDPSFAGITEVSDLVARVKELKHRA